MKHGRKILQNLPWPNDKIRFYCDTLVSSNIPNCRLGREQTGVSMVISPELIDLRDRVGCVQMNIGEMPERTWKSHEKLRVWEVLK